MRAVPWFLATSLLIAGAAQAAPRTTVIPQKAIAAATQLREQALASNLGYEITESLTTEVGPRLAGSEADARAVAWAQAKFKELGFDKVWIEPVTFPKWERRSESVEVLGPHSQKLYATALGFSAGGTVEGEVVRFDGLEALQAAPEGSLKGKIAFVDFRMEPKRDGADYRIGGGIRGKGPSEAARKGAIAYVMRSAGTDSHRLPHTGMTKWAEGVTPIPAAALSVPDAQQLTRLLALGPTKIRVALDCGMNGNYTSYNVIGEITGSRKPKEVVLIGGHLDSWDLGTGAIDDGAGVGISMAAAKLVKSLKPARTIRVVAFANEEQGLHGGFAYADKHAPEVARHAIAAESDFGAGQIYAFDSNAPEYALGAVKQIAAVLAPLGIEYKPGTGDPESDVGPSAAKGVVWASLSHDGMKYFDLHHTADDTIDKIDPKEIAQNVAAYAVFTYLAAEADGDFGSKPKVVEPAK